MKKVILLGATGSIGSQTLDIIRKNKNKLKLVGASLGSDLNLSIEIIKEFNPEAVVLRNFKQESDIKQLFPHIICYIGDEGLKEIAAFDFKGKVLFVNALSGFAGLNPTVEAIKTKKDILLANKETLVVAGELILPLIKKHKVKLLPIDSEHSAIFQCLIGEKKREVKKLIITASGGSLRNKKREELEVVSLEEVLKHPNWQMGKKITVDSASMMNKGLEVIEAHYLFDIPYDNIETLLHEESIIHSLVMFKDNSVKAQLGLSDMRIPISYALGYPKRLDFSEKELDLAEIGTLKFKKMDYKRFPLLGISYEAGKKGGTSPCVLNAANEAAVYLFLEGKIDFLTIEKIVISEVNKHEERPLEDFKQLSILHEEIFQNIINKYGGKKIC